MGQQETWEHEEEQEFWEKVNRTFLAHLNIPNRWRWGQTCMNVLRDDHPDLYEQITATPADPWHAHVSSDTYGLFVEKVAAYFASRTQ